MYDFIHIIDRTRIYYLQMHIIYNICSQDSKQKLAIFP